MRTRLTLTKRLTDDLYLSESVYPNLNKVRPSAKGMAFFFLAGAILFVVVCLVFISMFAP